MPDIVSINPHNSAKDIFGSSIEKEETKVQRGSVTCQRLYRQRVHYTNALAR
jgi:hypothetical protein